jgi:hypothetical protein
LEEAAPNDEVHESLHIIFQSLAWKFSLQLESIGQLNGHSDILQQLIVQSVGAVKLQNQMFGEGVLDALNHVLRLGL